MLEPLEILGTHQRGLVLDLSLDLKQVLIHQEIIHHHLDMVSLTRNQIKRRPHRRDNRVRRRKGELRLKQLGRKRRARGEIKTWNINLVCSSCWLDLRDFDSRPANPLLLRVNHETWVLKSLQTLLGSWLIPMQNWIQYRPLIPTALLLSVWWSR